MSEWLRNQPLVTMLSSSGPRMVRQWSPTYDWSGFFGAHMRKLPGIKKLRHFCFDASTPGKVHVRSEGDGAEQSHSLLIDDCWSPTVTVLPPIIPPSGLSLERQQYLFQKIREYCPEVRDVVCFINSRCYTHIQFHRCWPGSEEAQTLQQV